MVEKMPSATGKYLRQVVFFCGMGHFGNLLCHKPSGRMHTPHRGRQLRCCAAERKVRYAPIRIEGVADFVLSYNGCFPGL